MVKIDEEFIYESMLKKIYGEYCDLVMTYCPEDKVKVTQELGRIKAHTQKKRAKEFIHTLNSVEIEQAVLGCYEEIRIQLLRQLYRMLGGETKDYTEADGFLTEYINKEKKAFKQVLKQGLKEKK